MTLASFGLKDTTLLVAFCNIDKCLRVENLLAPISLGSHLKR